MFDKKSIIFLFLALNLVFGLKSIDFCTSKQQECNQNYQIKCEPIKCHEPFSFNCGFNICARNKTKCISLTRQHFANEEENKIKLFKKNVLECRNQDHKFETNDFCVNGQNCKIIKDLRFHKMFKKTDCQCPSKLSFKCDKYCALNSFACDYYKSNENNKAHFKTIKDCGNHNINFFVSYNNIW